MRDLTKSCIRKLSDIFMRIRPKQKEGRVRPVKGLEALKMSQRKKYFKVIFCFTFRAGNLLIGFPSEWLVFCPKMSE